MDKTLIEKYKAEMLKMYHSVKPVQATPLQNTPPQALPDGTGGLLASVTALRDIYPVPNAMVTVFTGEYPNIKELNTAVTDQSGRTEIFLLSAPSRELSQTADPASQPFATYNMMVRAEGYRDNIHINVPVFSGVVSLQNSNMMLLETAGTDKGPQIFDEALQNNL